MCFSAGKRRQHTAAGMQRALRGVQQQLPWLVKTPDLSPIEHVWDMMKRELTLSPEPATTIAELRQRVQDALDNLSQDDIRHLKTTAERSDTPPNHCAHHVQQSFVMSIQLPAGLQCDRVQMAKLRRQVQDAWDNLSKDDIRSFMTVCMQEYTPTLPPEEATLY